MLWLRKRVVPQILKILMLLFVVVVATDDLTVQSVFMNATPTLQQTLCSGDDGDVDRHVWMAPKYLSRSEHDMQRQNLAIGNYLEQFKGLLIPSSPSIFFQPDRAPPISYH